MEGRYPLSFLMSEEQLKAFNEKIQADPSLKQKLYSAADTAAVVEIAKSAGFVVSIEELQKAQSNMELSDEDLEGIAGGGKNTGGYMVYGCSGEG